MNLSKEVRLFGKLNIPLGVVVAVPLVVVALGIVLVQNWNRSTIDVYAEFAVEECSEAITKEPSTHNYLCRAEHLWDMGNIDRCIEDLIEACLKAEGEKDWKEIRFTARELKSREAGTGSYGNFYRSAKVNGKRFSLLK